MRKLIYVPLLLSAISCGDDSKKVNGNSDSPGRRSFQLMEISGNRVIPLDFKNSASLPSEVSKVFNKLTEQRSQFRVNSVSDDHAQRSATFGAFFSAAAKPSNPASESLSLPNISCDSVFDRVDSYISQANKYLGIAIEHTEQVINGTQETKVFKIKEAADDEAFKVEFELKDIIAAMGPDAEDPKNVSGQLTASAGANENQAFLRFSGEIAGKEVMVDDQLTNINLGADFEVFTDISNVPELAIGSGFTVQQGEDKAEGSFMLRMVGGASPIYQIKGFAEGDIQGQAGRLDVDGKLASNIDKTMNFVLNVNVKIPEKVSNIKITANLVSDNLGECQATNVECKGAQEFCNAIAGNLVK